ncbi:MAG: hypothetical protein WAP08_12590, partial [Smithellaceae bacterium]
RLRVVVSASAPVRALTGFRPISSLPVVPYRIASAFMGSPRDPDAYLRRFMFGPSAQVGAYYGLC